MTLEEVMKQLEVFGDAQTKKTLIRHGAMEPIFGVRVSDLKKILKKTKKNYELSLQLYKTGNSDAMYLAGLMADETKMTRENLEEWAEQAYWSYLSEFAVPWVASETPYGFELGLKWIKSPDEVKATTGWATLSSCAAVQEDENLDLDAYKSLLDAIPTQIHSAQNRVKHLMNAFVINIGSYVKPLSTHAQKIAKEIGVVTVDMGDTACKVPLATAYIQKVIDKGNLGKKRKNARC